MSWALGSLCFRGVAVAKQPWPTPSSMTQKFQQRTNGFSALKIALQLNFFKHGYLLYSCRIQCRRGFCVWAKKLISINITISIGLLNIAHSAETIYCAALKTIVLILSLLKVWWYLYFFYPFHLCCLCSINYCVGRSVKLTTVSIINVINWLIT